ncbi:unnamed protein product [Closterium sp. Yama58-4]|nr:unnamed protein product [Closterium sp. Yama58-4]
MYSSLVLFFLFHLAGFKLPKHVDDREAEWPIAARGADEEHNGGGHSDDERSIAGDSWSVKSEYGSTLDGDEARTAEMMCGTAIAEDSQPSGSAPEEREQQELNGLREHEGGAEGHSAYTHQSNLQGELGGLSGLLAGSAPSEGSLDDRISDLDGCAGGDGDDDGDDDGDEDENGVEDRDGAAGMRNEARGDGLGTYADELQQFKECGDPGEIWFGGDVMETCAEWTARIAAATAAALAAGALAATTAGGDSTGAEQGGEGEGEEDKGEAAAGARGASGEGASGAAAAGLAGAAAGWRVVDVGTGNGLLLHALARHG